MKRIYLIIAILVAATYQQTNAQGCVAIKGIGGICNRPSEGGSWYMDINNRYFKSYKHFIVKEEQKTRHSTNSFSIGDIRFAAYRWMFDPKTTHKENLQVGLGLKLPTGSYNYMDYFYKKPDSSVLGPVDQSIQPGDGGTGITLELNGF